MSDKGGPYSCVETLKGGGKFTIRAVRPDDGPKIRRAFYHLAPHTRYMRFLAPKAEVSDAELARITQADFKNSIALLATIGEGDKEVVIGGASCYTINPAAAERSGEVAFTVEEEFQGRGVGGVLMRHLAAITRAKGFHTLWAEVLCSNAPMLNVFRRSGLPMKVEQDGNVLQVALSL
jgi:GNAT superfamily N-acetyltransferase